MKTFTVSALSLLMATCLAAPHPEPAKLPMTRASHSGSTSPAPPMSPPRAAADKTGFNTVIPRSLDMDVWRVDGTDNRAAGDGVSTPTDDDGALLGDDDVSELPAAGVEEDVMVLDEDGDEFNVTDTEDAAPTLERRQTACGLPYCSGETSFYDFTPGDIFFCDRVIGRNRNSRRDKIVALPGFRSLFNRSLCGATITLTWNGRSTTAIVGDRCPDRSCNARNRRIDLSRATFISLGGSPNQGVLQNVQWKISR